MSNNSSARNLVAAIAAVALSVAIAFDAQAVDKSMGMKEGHSPGSMEMHKSMMKGMKDMESMPMSGNADRDFAMMMKHHHQGGVDMAEAELKHGKDAKMRGMAEKIIKAQKNEIKELNEWLAQSK